MKTISSAATSAALIILFLAGSTTVMAADGEALYKGKACMTCHGAAGKEPIMPLYPKIAGQNKEYLIQQMQDIKSGKRSNGQSAVMKPMMTNVSDEEIIAIAEYLAKQ